MQDIKFVYNSPAYLLEITETTFHDILKLKQQDKEDLGTLLNKKCHFIVMCAAAVEAHLNWYYYFDRKINVDEKQNGKYWMTDEKIKNAPLNRNTKGQVRAIFELRNQIMHPKYKPRNGFDQFPYELNFVLLSLGTLIDVCEELLTSCPETLNGRISLTEKQRELSFRARNIILPDINGEKINWVEAIKTQKVSLPMPSLADV